jgi:hypothetical protein
MVLTDYEIVFPMTGDVLVDNETIVMPDGDYNDADVIESLAKDVDRSEWDYMEAMRDLANYKSTVENHDAGTIGELVERAERYRGCLVGDIAKLLVVTIALSRAWDITCSDIQLAIDRYAGLAS